jgi:hypothetical protein
MLPSVRTVRSKNSTGLEPSGPLGSRIRRFTKPPHVASPRPPKTTTHEPGERRPTAVDPDFMAKMEDANSWVEQIYAELGL